MSLRALKVLVIAMGVLILAGTVTLVAVIVQRVGGAGRSGLGGGAGAEPAALALRQPAGTRIAGVATVEERVAIWVERADGEGRVLLVDPRRNRVVGEIRVGE